MTIASSARAARALVSASLAAGALLGWLGGAQADAAPALAPPPAAAAASPRAPVARGFAFAVRLDRVRLLRPDVMGGQTPSDFDTVPAFFVGYKLGRLLVGGAFMLSSQGVATSSTGMPDRSTRDTTVELGPELQLALSSAGAAELYGELDVTAGHVFSDRQPAGMASTSSDRLGFRLGLGVRGWLTPHLACAALAGLAGQSIYTDSRSDAGGGAVMTSTSSGMLDHFARLEVLAVF